MSRTKINWTDHSIGGARMGLYGCEHIGFGCMNCWASAMAQRYAEQWGLPEGTVRRGRWTGKVTTDESKVAPAFASLPKVKPCRVFAPSSADLFHDAVPLDYILAVFHEMGARPYLTFQVLTKRYRRSYAFVREALCNMGWPPNVHLGWSISTQDELDGVVPYLFVDTLKPWLSIEPLIEPIDVSAAMHFGCRHVVVGCESGSQRRGMDWIWAKDIASICKWEGVPCFVKQLPLHGKIIHGPDDAGWPEWAVQELPEVAP